MPSVLLRLSALALALQTGRGVSEDYKIEDLPGAPSPLGFAQYSGYVEVDAALGKSLFFWFVESQGTPADDPLVLWLNGGPGSSSIGYGEFFRVTR